MKIRTGERRTRSQVGRSGAPIILALVLVVLLLVLDACGSDDQVQSTTSETAPNTSTTAEPTSSTAADSSTTSSASTSSTAPRSDSTDTTVGSPTTEALSSAEMRLPNGNIKAMGYIDAAWEEGGTRYISIDYAEMLTGDEALEAAHEAGAIPPEQDWVDNDYFIRNVNPMKREFAVADSVVITTASFGAVMDLSIGWDVFRSFWTEFPPEGGSHMYDMPWWIERDGQTVVKIEEQYLP